MPSTYDAAIIGGGPAGAAAAISLSRAGHSVVLLERTHYQSPRIGETLPPAARPLLERLGVWERFLQDTHGSSPGTLAAWGSGDLAENHFITNPYGSGWHLNRAKFDARLTQLCRREGRAIISRRAHIVVRASRAARLASRVIQSGRRARQANAKRYMPACWWMRPGARPWSVEFDALNESQSTISSELSAFIIPRKTIIARWLKLRLTAGGIPPISPIRASLSRI